ncbi:MAG: HAD-IA family hydrolase [Thermoplasmata archaeon]|nr:HAD-IA family hydrolase [Thermoplasmata archaeon]
MGDRFPVYEEVLAGLGVRLGRLQLERAERAVAATSGAFTSVYLGKPRGFWNEYERKIVNELGLTVSSAVVVEQLRDCFASSRKHPAYAETEGVLEKLANRGTRLHLLSNYTELLPEILVQLGWSRRFVTVTYSQEAGAEKPARAIFELALRRAGCAPERAAMVGDSWEADVLGAWAAGLNAVWVDRDGHHPERAGPMVRDLAGILPLLPL